jgi:class 3 adenylate cyclase/pimeloyl-ACP methyl ester carboxylesterase
MDPSIQYVTTRDGLNIAYYVIGESEQTALFYSIPFSHLEAEWQIPAMRAAFTLAAQDRRLIRLDPRGFGLSDRDVVDFSVDAMVLDIEAVMERLGVGQLRIQALGPGSVPAIAYAARHAEVDALILQPPAASARDIQVQRLLALESLIAVDWEFASETAIRSFNPHWPDPMIKEFAAFLRKCMDADDFNGFWESTADWDVDDLARTVRAKTLIIHNRNDPNEELHTTRRVAALFPDAHIAFVNDIFEGRRAVQEFYYGEPAAASEESPPALPSGTAIIVFTDIADSTVLTERLGDAAFRAASRSLDESIRSAMRAASGTPVDGKVLGDGVMGIFTSAARAIEAAQACVASSAEVELPLHIGIHAGDVIREDNNVYGGAVNIASRICGLCAPGDILVSQTVRDLARTSASVTFEDRGEQTLKGIDDAIRVFAVQLAAG